jgi:hypothetical protein
MIPLNPNIPHGLCQCGCGQKTKIAPKHYKCFGVKRGEPWRFLAGHQRKVRPIIEEAVPFRLHGIYCRLVELTQGQYAIVDADKYDEVMQQKWYARWDKDNNGYYAVAHKITNGKRGTIWMHRWVLGLPPEDKRQTDHIDPLRTTENCTGNLRPASKFESAQNKRKLKSNTSGRKGVSFNRDTGKWRAAITAEGVKLYLKEYDSFEEACAVREAAENKYHGEFARKE